MTALVRPESVKLTPQDGADAHVLAVSFLGSVCRVQVQLPSGAVVGAQMAASEVEGLAPGTPVQVVLLPSPVFAVADAEALPT